MGEINSYRDLIVWKKSMDTTQTIYKLTKAFPDTEKYGMISQLRRASVSIPANIAEGYGRQSTKDYVRFLQIARGSLYEVQTLLELSNGLDYISKDAFTDIYKRSREIEAMLQSLINKLKKYSLLKK